MRQAAVSTSIIDDDITSITRYDFEPGAETGHHTHAYDYIVVPLTRCDFLIIEDGEERRVSSTAGAAYKRPAGVSHNVINGGVEPMSFIEIELKV